MSKNRIQSYIFFDIETTGLPYQERNRTKIIELSFVAALREDLEATSNGYTPPVKKLTFVLNPRRKIHQKVCEMTGLNNELLRNAPTFGQKVNSLISFIESLPKPVCLVAHNGNSFDFKILLSECIDAGASMPSYLLCVDSIIGFRKILKNLNMNVVNAEVQQSPNSTVEIIDDFFTDDEDEWPDLNISNEDWQEIDDIVTSFSDMSCEDFTESVETETISVMEMINENRTEAIKNLFNSKPKEDKVSYSLSALYKRLFNKEEDNAHRAEVDCLMLIQCVVALKSDFLPWADGACKLLNVIKPLRRY